MKCRPLRVNDQMQCHCGLAWDIDEEKPECNGVNLAKGKDEMIYSMRAECRTDIVSFEILAHKIDTNYKVLKCIQPENFLPDIHYEFQSSMSLSEVESLIARFEDSHVMLETLRQCPLNENTLGRCTQIC